MKLGFQTFLLCVSVPLDIHSEALVVELCCKASRYGTKSEGSRTEKQLRCATKVANHANVLTRLAVEHPHVNVIKVTESRDIHTRS